jgi:hypothetical protein
VYLALAHRRRLPVHHDLLDDEAHAGKALQAIF